MLKRKSLINYTNQKQDLNLSLQLANHKYTKTYSLIIFKRNNQILNQPIKMPFFHFQLVDYKYREDLLHEMRFKLLGIHQLRATIPIQSVHCNSYFPKWISTFNTSYNTGQQTNLIPRSMCSWWRNMSQIIEQSWLTRDNSDLFHSWARNHHHS